ncbi:hypothetical protein PHMEG_00030165 [Phytophthora megakarya]|uniref:Uncharacterized protein n=1 Tax=Phytophthora megakarya TaxID=4795 RepID=A0A225V126_9STRA|nr:hypothetical protein PHMEG_00030165 [Phytophthora megakarya]
MNERMSDFEARLERIEIKMSELGGTITHGVTTTQELQASESEGDKVEAPSNAHKSSEDEEMDSPAMRKRQHSMLRAMRGLS